MNIGVDAGSMRGVLTGIGWYVWQTMQALLRLDPADSFFLYASRPLTVKFDARNVTSRAATRASRLPGVFWQQVYLPRFARRDALDCFWGPSHVLPLNLPETVRAVLTVNDLVALLYPDAMATYNALVHRLYWEKSIRRADALITISEQTKRDLVDRFGIDAGRITVTPLGVESRFRPLPHEVVEKRLAEMQLTRGYALTVGTLEPRKNYERLLQAWSQLAGNPVLAIVGGRGWKYQSVIETRRRLGLERNVMFLGYVSDDDLVVLYNGARLLVFPSLYEGFGLPVVQAMACGTPVLASRSSSLPEVGGDAVEYFDPRSVESLLAATRSLLPDDSRLHELRERGLKRALQFTWESVAERTLRVLRGEKT